MLLQKGTKVIYGKFWEKSEITFFFYYQAPGYDKVPDCTSFLSVPCSAVTVSQQHTSQTYHKKSLIASLDYDFYRCLQYYVYYFASLCHY